MECLCITFFNIHTLCSCVIVKNKQNLKNRFFQINKDRFEKKRDGPITEVAFHVTLLIFSHNHIG